MKGGCSQCREQPDRLGVEGREQKPHGEVGRDGERPWMPSRGFGFILYSVGSWSGEEWDTAHQGGASG